MGAAVDLSLYPFISIQRPTNQSQVIEFARTLDPGESEAIALAIEVNATALLIDELAGRAAAAAAGISFVGVLGILARAKHDGSIPDVRSRIDRLRSEIQFYISNKLYDQFLKSIGE